MKKNVRSLVSSFFFKWKWISLNSNPPFINVYVMIEIYYIKDLIHQDEYSFSHSN